MTTSNNANRPKYLRFTSPQTGLTGDEDGSSLAPGAATGSSSQAPTDQPTASEGRAHSRDSALGDDLSACIVCGRLREYCHGHEVRPISPTPLPTRPRHARTQLVETFNLNRDQAAALAARLNAALQINDEDTRRVPTYNEDRADRSAAPPLYQPRAQEAERVGVSGGRGRGQNGRRGRPADVHTSGPSTNAHPEAPRQPPARRSLSPTPQGYEHNRGARYIPFIITNQGQRTPARYTQVHLTGPNPYALGRASLRGVVHRQELHAHPVNDTDLPAEDPSPEALKMLGRTYLRREAIDDALARLNDLSAVAEVQRWRALLTHEQEIEEAEQVVAEQRYAWTIERGYVPTAHS